MVQKRSSTFFPARFFPPKFLVTRACLGNCFTRYCSFWAAASHVPLQLVTTAYAFFQPPPFFFSRQPFIAMVGCAKDG